MRVPILLPALLLGLAMPTACQAPKGKFQPILKITPKAPKVAPGATITFSAAINYEPDGPRYPRQPVRWSVVEGDKGGTITRAGLYTAPGLEGVYHVRAEREDFPGIAAEAEVTVKAQR
jgi:hypothetical protein